MTGTSPRLVFRRRDWVQSRPTLAASNWIIIGIRRHRTGSENLTACAALIVAGIGSVFLVGLLAADFYASLMHYGPFEIVRALVGLH